MNTLAGPCHPKSGFWCRHSNRWYHCNDEGCNKLVKVDYTITSPPEAVYNNHKIGSGTECKFRDRQCDICGIQFRGLVDDIHKDERYGEAVTLYLCQNCKSQVGAKIAKPRHGFKYAPFYLYPIPVLCTGAVVLASSLFGFEPNIGMLWFAALPGVWMMSQCKE